MGNHGGGFPRSWGGLTAVRRWLEEATVASGMETIMWAPPSHRLEEVQITLYLPGEHDSGVTSMRVAGRASTKRANLWTYQEHFDPSLDAEKGYSVSDAVHHVALVCLQDRPNTLARLDFALRGGLSWSQDELPGL